MIYMLLVLNSHGTYTLYNHPLDEAISGLQSLHIPTGPLLKCVPPFPKINFPHSPAMLQVHVLYVPAIHWTSSSSWVLVRSILIHHSLGLLTVYQRILGFRPSDRTAIELHVHVPYIAIHITQNLHMYTDYITQTGHKERETCLNVIPPKSAFYKETSTYDDKKGVLNVQASIVR